MATRCARSRRWSTYRHSPVSHQAATARSRARFTAPTGPPPSTCTASPPPAGTATAASAAARSSTSAPRYSNSRRAATTSSSCAADCTKRSARGHRRNPRRSHTRRSAQREMPSTDDTCRPLASPHLRVLPGRRVACTSTKAAQEPVNPPHQLHPASPDRQRLELARAFDRPRACQISSSATTTQEGHTR
jgi:hypothetical protein